MRRHPRFLTLLAGALVACGPREKPAPVVATGSATASAALPPGESYLVRKEGRTWYKVSGGGSATPAIIVHGGPGFPSYYVKAYERLADERPVVRYDQIGGGKSDPVRDTTLWTIDQFVDELDRLRAHLGYDKVHLVGMSWGSMLSYAYYQAHPEHVASLTLAGAPLDIPALARHARVLLKTLPDSVQQVIARREAEKNYAAPDYQHAMEVFYGRYVWMRPDPVELDSTLKGANESVYNYMQGPSEFTITGTFKDWDVTTTLKDVKVPVLYTVGEFDEVDPVLVRRYADLTPGATYAVIPNAAHVTTWDNPDSTLSATRAFLRSVDATASH
jgi:proline iminopeptidase